MLREHKIQLKQERKRVLVYSLLISIALFIIGVLVMRYNWDRMDYVGHILLSFGLLCVGGSMLSGCLFIGGINADIERLRMERRDRIDM